MKRSETGRMGVFWRIFGYLCGFTVILLVFLWLFQVVFLDVFYRSIKTRSLHDTAKTIARNINDEDVQELLQQLAQRNSTCIRVVSADGLDRYSVEVQPCAIHKLNREQLSDLFHQTKISGSGDLEQVFQEQLVGKNPKNNSDEGEPGRRRDNWPGWSELRHSMNYSQLVTTDSGEELLVLVNTVISPVWSTTETLRVQLACITAIMVLLSLLLSWVIARRIAAPIEAINTSAKELATGNYETRFSGTGYREIAELGDTLNYTAGELSKVEALRKELIANVSHDLRTPLTMIAGYAEVIRDIPGENTPENVQVIIDETNWLTTLVNDMLDLSKLQSGTQELHCSPYNLTERLWQVLERYTQLVQVDGYKIVFYPSREVWVDADEVKITQVLYNLINNAVNYTGEDKTVQVDQTVEEGWVTLSVRDSGEGIPADQLPMIWERYYKVDKTHRRAAIGSGMGLSIVRSVLELHGARYGVKSVEGQGSRFWFALPVVDPPFCSKEPPALPHLDENR